MITALWIVGGLVAYTLGVALPVAVLIGRTIRLGHRGGLR